MIGWADDEMILAHLLGSMLTGYTEVEELIAIGSLAQDDLAHASLLYELLEPDMRERDRLFYEREPAAFRNCGLVGHVSEDWAVVVVRHHLYEAAERLRLERVASMPEAPKPLVELAEGMYAEERLHRAHWEHWCEVIAGAAGGSERLAAAVEELWPATADVFVAPEGLAWPDDALHSEWRAAVEQSLRPLGVELPASASAASDAGRRGRHQPPLLESLRQSRTVYQQDPEAIWG